MQRLIARNSWHRLAAATAAACLLTAASAAAQVGTAVTPLIVQGVRAAAFIGFSGIAQSDVATAAGGVTLFTAYVPNGPLLARLPIPPPFLVDPDSSTPSGWQFYGVPPGTYYVAVVYGIVAAPSIAATDWVRLVVPGVCTGAPGLGMVDRRSAEAEPSTVRLFLATFGGCATSYLVEAGTSPGVANVASIETSQFLLSAVGVPTGSYYVRVRGRNEFGIGPYSAVLPVSVPGGCPPELTEIGSVLTAAVVGHQVTLTWTPPVPAPQGGPITYYELARLDGRPPGSPTLPFLLPGTARSFTATVPSGTYAVGLYAGNACWSSGPTGIASVSFTVP